MDDKRISTTLDYNNSFPTKRFSMSRLRKKTNYTVVLVDAVRYDPWDPSGPAPSPETVAHGLSNLNRYGGHTMRPLSVAEHSIFIALYIACKGSDNSAFRVAARALADGDDRWVSVFGKITSERAKVALLGLIHDCPEGCGLVDVPSPVGRHPEMAEYKKAHERCMEWLSEAWDIPPPPWPDEVKAVDTSILGAEVAIRPAGTVVMDETGKALPQWPGLDLAFLHNLSLQGAKYIRDAWVSAFKTLKVASKNKK